MSNPELIEEPVVDTASRHHIGEPSQDEIEGHRSEPAMLQHSLGNFVHGITNKPSNQQSAHHRHRRRRKRGSIIAAKLSSTPLGDPSRSSKDHQVTDPGEHVMFLLGECDGEEDTTTHRLFCELDELCHDPTGSGETEWREAARWIKFEEDVEENGERWSKPHVATLPLFSLFELRNCLANGAVMLNVEAYTMEHIADLILNLLCSQGMVQMEHRDRLYEILLRRHVHLHERLRSKLGPRSAATHLPLIRSLAEIGKRHSSKEVDREASNTSHAGGLTKLPTFTGMDSLDPSTAAHVAAHAQAHSQATGGGGGGGAHSEFLSGSLQGKFDLHFLKKIAPGSETANILIGETSFLTSAITVLVRLKEAVLLGDITEVPVPTRFLFLHLGVVGSARKAKELGRSMGVLMSDEVFHDVAYKARDRADLLAGLDEFLSVATILPPGEWDPSIRIEPPASVPSQDSRKPTTSVAATNNGAPASSVAPPPSGAASSSHLGQAATVIGLDHHHDNSTSNNKVLQDKVDVNDSLVAPPPLATKEPDLEVGGGSPGGSGGPGGDEPGGGPPGGGPVITSDDPGGDGHGNDPALQRTGRLFGGLVRDIKRRAPHYLSDFKDALHIQCCASFIFLYFACLTPIVAFGGLLSSATEGNLGAIESILSGAVVGITYALFSGQPLTIMGSTGPVLVFESIVFKLCKPNMLNFDYLSFRLWIGLWVALALLILVAFDLSFLVKFITRFTEESFATLIALIFIYEAIKKTLHIKDEYPVGVNWDPADDPINNCECQEPTGLGKNELMRYIYANKSLLSIPVNANDKLVVPGAMKEGEFVNLTINWTAISVGRYSWDSLEYRKLCTELKGQWVGSDCDRDYAVPDVFFFSCVLFILTFVLAYGLKLFRTSAFCPTRVRTLVSDFSVIIAIIVATLVDYLFSLRTPKLEVPSAFEPTLGYARRGWIVPPFGEKNPWWSALVALLPALVAVILIFMDQQITAVIVNRRENKLKVGGFLDLELEQISHEILMLLHLLHRLINTQKGPGYHLDLLIVAILIAVNSILGIPWFVAATVLSINHVNSLRKESATSAPGERPEYLGCREQRVTGVLIFLFIGLSVFMTKLLAAIPMAVLFGIFLFMGISSLNGVQMIQRLGLLFMPVKYQPDYDFLRHVSLRRVHFFTVVQIVCLAALWVIKSFEYTAILFPIMVAAMCFIRKLLDFIFTQDELRWLDDILPGARPRKRKALAFRVSSCTEMHQDLKQGANSWSGLELLNTQRPETKRINITEEVSKTSIWRQLSGVDIKNAITSRRKSKDVGGGCGKRSKKSSRKTSSSTPMEPMANLTILDERDSTADDDHVVFSINPDDDHQLYRHPPPPDVIVSRASPGPDIRIDPPSTRRDSGGGSRTEL